MSGEARWSSQKAQRHSPEGVDIDLGFGIGKTAVIIFDKRN